MAQIGDVISNPAAKMRMEVLATAASSDGELFEVEATYEPESNEPMPHLHPSQDERFEIRAGTMRVKMEGTMRDLEAGDVLEIPRDTPHSMWNPSAENRAVVLWQTRPALRTEQFFEAVAALMAKDEPDSTEGAQLVGEFSDVFRPAPSTFSG